MSFSDWITIVSIFMALLFAVFKFDEREIIRLKKVWKFAWPSIVLLILSGISAFFHSNRHPAILNVFWNINGLDSGVWPILWLFVCVLTTIVAWKIFVHQPPTASLIEQYIDMLKFMEPTAFSMLFRKYERYFFNNVKDEKWLQYQELFSIPKWWHVAPVHFKSILKDHPDRFFKMDDDILKTLLRVQFSNANTLMMEELESWPETGSLEEKPLLNILLGSKGSIRKGRDRNILIPTVKELAFQYFSSIDFIEHDKRIMTLRPVDDSFNMAIPEKLMVFYFINFIHWYWIRVITSKPAVAGFYQYEFWVEVILENAPKLNDGKLSKGGHPNYYCLAVARVLDNISDWIQKMDHDQINDMKWAIDHFILLKLHILKDISNKYSEKVRHDWLISELTGFMFDLLKWHKMGGKDFELAQWLNDHRLPESDVQDAFADMTNQEFVTAEEKAAEGYQWISKTLKKYYKIE